MAVTKERSAFVIGALMNERIKVYTLITEHEVRSPSRMRRKRSRAGKKATSSDSSHGRPIAGAIPKKGE